MLLILKCFWVLVVVLAIGGTSFVIRGASEAFQSWRLMTPVDSCPFDRRLMLAVGAIDVLAAIFMASCGAVALRQLVS